METAREFARANGRDVVSLFTEDCGIRARWDGSGRVVVDGISAPVSVARAFDALDAGLEAVADLGEEVSTAQEVMMARRAILARLRGAA
jgi:hypothetical protein